MRHADAAAYDAIPVIEDGDLVDIVLQWPERSWRLAGKAGAKRERDLLKKLNSDGKKLPVLLGSGLGVALEELLEQTSGPVAVVDKEQSILDVSKLAEQYAGEERVFWIVEPDLPSALKALTQWQMRHEGLPFVPLSHPVYLRIDRDYYGGLQEQLQASGRFDFWAKARYTKFKTWPPRILLVTSQYFLMGEIIAACTRLQVPYLLVNLEDKEIASQEFVERLLRSVLEFRPDFIFTINHLGVDREGVLVDLLERLELPLASWFVDNPHLILYLFNKVISDYTAIFTWDSDNIDTLKEQGFQRIFYLPLGTDPERFRPGLHGSANNTFTTDVCFVGNSMHYKVGQRLKASRPPKELLRSYRAVAAGFGNSDEKSVYSYLLHEHQDLLPYFMELESAERKLAYEAMITWEATRQYRLQCVQGIMDFNPLVVGDKGWNISLKAESRPWRWHKEVSYYEDLPWLYPLVKVNFNCTSKQMKGAVNQRVFDVPATGAFVLTDWRVQIEQLFIPGQEVICFNHLDEVPDLTKYYLSHPHAREKIALAARKRILAEHSYQHRLLFLMRKMHSVFG